jgi:hypothetical protein
VRADLKGGRAPLLAGRRWRFVLRQTVDPARYRPSSRGKPLPTDEREPLVKYLMLVCWDADNMNGEPDPTPAVLAAADEESFPWLDDVQARGVRLDGDRLAPPRRAATVRVRDGKAVITEGPFIETKEAIGGFDILECASMAEALEIAAAHPVAQGGAIEVRPFYGSP